ncbi:MAG: inositol monophosphatase [Anaerolineales bacterium]|nr:inositol monophosphatase [Anaerolineales bacterium]
MESPAEFATRLALEAGRLLSEYFRQSDLLVSWKADRTLLTEADLAADRYITQAIQRSYPDDLLLSEENLQGFEPTGTESIQRAVWVVDPLDGTTNFSLGLPVWGTLITRLVNGWPEISVLNFPLLNELYSAEKGAGASLNGQPIRTGTEQHPPRLPFFACCSRTFRKYQVSIPYKARILGSAAYSFCLAARGAAVVSFEARTKLWDIAGPWLLVTEAGGWITAHQEIQPFPLRAGIDYHHQNFATLAASTADELAKAQASIQPLTPG